MDAQKILRSHIEYEYNTAYDTFKAVKKRLLKDYPQSVNGLTPDVVKFNPEYRQAKQVYDHAFQQLRNLNNGKLTA